MKIKFNTNLLINIIIIGVVLLLFFEFYSFSNMGSTSIHTFGDNEGDAIYTWKIDNLTPIGPQVSDSLPYYKYKSLKQKAQSITDLNNGDFNNLGSEQFGYVIGVGSSSYCDTCTLNTDLNSLNIPGIKRHYILLPGWKLKETDPGVGDSLVFHIDHGQAFIRKTILDKAVRNKSGSISGETHRADIPVNFAYNRWYHCVAISVTESTKNILSYIVTGFAILFVLYLFYMISAFLKFVIDLSKGLSFTDKNIWRLKLIAVSLLTIPVVMFLLNLLIWFLFKGRLTSDVALNNKTWTEQWEIIVTGIVFLLLFKAFKQGKLLKEEQELTV